MNLINLSIKIDTRDYRVTYYLFSRSSCIIYATSKYECLLDMVLQYGASTFGGMDWWNGIVEWNTRMPYFIHAPRVRLGLGLGLG